MGWCVGTVHRIRDIQRTCKRLAMFCVAVADYPRETHSFASASEAKMPSVMARAEEAR